MSEPGLTSKRPDITVVEVLNYYDGPIEFLARYVAEVFESGIPHYRVIYGCLAEDSSVSSDQVRTYDLWKLPPIAKEPQWQISEDELKYEADDE